LLATGWVGAAVANRVAGPYLRLAFGLFVTVLGPSLVYGALQRLRVILMMVGLNKSAALVVAAT
jgi:hypothetical protein